MDWPRFKPHDEAISRKCPVGLGEGGGFRYNIGIIAASIVRQKSPENNSMARWFRRFLKNWKRSARRRTNVTARAARARHANWTVGAIAALLVLLSAGGYFYHRRQLDAIAAEHLRLFVAGPSHIQSGLAARYTIETTTIDGRPLPAEIEVVISKPSGEMIKAFKEKVGDDGRLVVTIPADMELPPRVKLKAAATHEGSSDEMESILPVRTDDFTSWLTLDRSVYQPGDTVRFRLLTLSEFGGKEIPDKTISYALYRNAPHAAEDVPVQKDMTTHRGIAEGKLDLPGDLPNGYCYLNTTLDNPGSWVGLSQQFRVRVSSRKAKNSNSAVKRVVKPVSGKSDADEKEVESDKNIDASDTVFAPGSPLKLKVSSLDDGRPVMAVAFFKGAQIGQTRYFSAADENEYREITVPINDQIGGLVRVVFFDCGDKHPKPVAEQYVYRQPSRKLNVQFVGAAKHYKPGEKVKLNLLATDEAGRPMPAVMSVLAGKERQIDDNRISEIEAFRKSLYAGNYKPDDNIHGGLPADLDLQVADSNTPLASIDPPLIFDNGEKVRVNYVNCLAEYQSKRTAFWDTLTATTFFGGLGLVVLVAMLGLMRIVSGMHLWVSAIGATVCCMILGAILSDPIEAPADGDSVAIFTSNVPQADEPDNVVSFAEYETDGLHNIIETIYWNPLLIAGDDGKAVIEFDLPPGEATYQIDIESHGEGRVGVDRMAIVVSEPVEIDTKEEMIKEIKEEKKKEEQN